MPKRVIAPFIPGVRSQKRPSR